MATIDATVGGAGANSYVTVAEADSYFGERLHSSAWTSANEAAVKIPALIWAAKLLDRTVRFNGQKATEDQAREWPRTGMKDNSGYDVPDDEIPQVVKDVQCELAMLLITSDRTLESDVASQGITSIKAGPVGLTFKDTIDTPKAVPDTLIAMFPIGWIWVVAPYPLVVS